MRSGRVREEHIFKVAASLFSRKGFHSTSIREIADAVGMQGGSLYYYIEGKEDLLYRILDHALNNMIEQMEDVVARNEPASRKLAMAIKAHLSLGQGFLDDLSVLIRETMSLPPEQRQRISERRDYYDDLFQSIIEEGARAGQFRGLDPKISTYAILGSCNWFFQWYSPAGRLSLDQIADILIDVFSCGLLTGEQCCGKE
ncbi:MAG: TetR/AcrR family transcriptional regulator [Chloroflexi bacterium]|nr:TetR/AcrR family transcriptional regulator [Chloroflexota bacterium]